MKTYHLIILGKVQGVWYRASAKQKADQLGIKGWVRNLPSGDVEALIQGEEQNLNEMILWCKKGPEYAVVTNVNITEKKTDSEFKDFNIRR